jgi:fucose permease
MHTREARIGLAGFFISGLLMAFLGAILPAWGYHVRSDYPQIGLFFLSLNAGLLISVRAAVPISSKWDLSSLLATACGLAFASLVYLTLMGPPVSGVWRTFGLLGLGAGAGLLNTAIFHLISTAYRRDPTATVNLAGTLFGFGCFVATVLIAGAFSVYTVGSTLFLMALIPGFATIFFVRTHLPSAPLPVRRTIRDAAGDFRSASAILFSLLLFFQFGNEWSIAGWLPLFLIQRLGVSPPKALLVLALYWLALTLGRLVVQGILPRVHRGKLLTVSVVAAIWGCVVLTFTDNLFGAIFGTLLVGFGFAPVYPLVVGMIGARFPYYHPGFFNGIFSFALTGGFMAPTLLGLVAEERGIQSVMLLPMIGTWVVLLLLIAIWVTAIEE